MQTICQLIGQSLRSGRVVIVDPLKLLCIASLVEQNTLVEVAA
jgi:hypothetical protein